MPPSERGARRVPPRALYLSLAALAVPVLGALALPETLGESGALLWLVALIPAFLLAYHRGWKGAATALAAGMATLSLTQVAANAFGLRIPEILLGIVVAYVALTMAIGWLAEVLHRDLDEVEEMAFTDGLTGLPNRRHAEIFLDAEFEAARRGRNLAVALFDLDHFKDYNDTYGHAAGDQALQGFAEVLRRRTRRMNLCARFGGEEFIAVLAGSDPVGATIFADRVRSSLREEGFGDPPLTCSSGVAAYDSAMQGVDDLLAAADAALYEAKRAGRDRVQLARASISVPSSPLPGDRRSRDRSPEGIAEGHLPAHELSGFGEGRRLLLVESDVPVRGVVGEYLRREGFEVIEVDTVAGGIRALSEEFDLLITDLRLPDASGHELVSEARRLRPAMPVLIVSDVPDARMAADALHAGADRYLFKPFGMPELRDQLAGALERRDRERAEGRSESGGTEEPARRRDARSDVLRGALSLVRAVEVRDPWTRGHSARVAAFAGRIADLLDPDAVLLPRQRLSLGCQLHDVGKLGIPDDILNKEGALEPDELDRVRTHPTVGRTILEPLLDDALVLGVVAWHHEHWDGSGYPDGIAGEAIPLAARVVAVADALAAMTHPRAHREAIEWETAVAEIEAGRGTRFDPRVLDAVVAVLPELERMNREPDF